MLNQLRITCTIFLLAGCNSDAITGSPAENSLNGLSYDFVGGAGFTGLPETTIADMPTQGTALYSGVLRGNITEQYESGAATLQVNFTNADINLRGSVDFKGQDGFGIVSLDENAKISGNAFQNTVTNATEVTVSGMFYGSEATMAAGFVGVPVNDDHIFSGTFIAQKR